MLRALQPTRDVVFTAVVRCSHRLEHPGEKRRQMLDVLSSQPDRRLGLIKLTLTHGVQSSSGSVFLRRVHRQLKQPARTRRRFGKWSKNTLLSNEREYKTRIELARFRGAEYRLSIRRWISIRD